MEREKGEKEKMNGKRERSRKIKRKRKSASSRIGTEKVLKRKSTREENTNFKVE